MRDAQELVNALYQQGVDLDTDESILSDLDEEWAVPCEFQDHQGPEPAQWVLWPSCCTVNGSPYALGCHGCKDRKINPDIAILCDDCGTVYHPASTAWRLIESLNDKAK